MKHRKSKQKGAVLVSVLILINVMTGTLLLMLHMDRVEQQLTSEWLR